MSKVNFRFFLLENTYYGLGKCRMIALEQKAVPGDNKGNDFVAFYSVEARPLVLKLFVCRHKKSVKQISRHISLGIYCN